MADENVLTLKRPKDEMIPYKKKRTKLVDLFNRASIAANPDECTKVFLRVKPFTEDEDSSQKCLNIVADENAVWAMAPDSSHAHKSSTRGLAKSSHKFTFSQIFDENTSQPEFFNATMLDMTKQFIGGQNSLVFSYGVTSSGKTYTIQGKAHDAGILPRSLDVLFNSISGKQIYDPSMKPEMFSDVVKLSADEVLEEKKIKKQTLKLGVNEDPTMMSLMGDEMESVLSDTAMSGSSGMDEILADVVNREREKLKVDVEEKIRFGVWVSFAEVYNESVYDLLVPVPLKKKGKRQTLRISDDRNGNPYIKGLKQIHVESADEAYKLLAIGQRNLMTACTRLNHCSSRSHSIFNIKIVRIVDTEDPHIACVSTLSLCDLAGSERYSKTQASGDRLKEAGNINTSLMTLGRCIETLRHNQLHRDQQRLVPFRDSKLTRILQNFFNGCGKAAMIVNVSPSASMFDETLHVFKFSAIAKQVKYENPPEERKLLRINKVVPPLNRQTIGWEFQESAAVLTEAQNVPLPDDDDDDDIIDDFEDEDLSDSAEMRKYIESLENRNKSLLDMLADELQKAQSNESRIRQEVYESMQKQMVIIEESYNTMLRDDVEAQEEFADERVKGIMEVYEKRLERIQRKVDEEDEWVSSMLYYQEQTKVEEKEAKIAELEKQLQEKQSMNDSVDIGNSVLVETLTKKLQEAADEIASKEAQVTELRSLVEEAGETYSNNMEEIKTLRENLAQEQKTVQLLTGRVSDLEEKVSETKEAATNAEKAIGNKETEWLAAQEEFLSQLKKKDTAISSLEEECKELQEEIERLQDQMSQIDEQSRCQRDLDTSTMSEKNLKLKHNLSINENSLCGETKLKLGKENICNEDILTKVKKQNSELADELANVKNELENKQKDIVALKMQNGTLESSHATTLKEIEAMSKELDICKDNLKQAQEQNDELTCDSKSLETALSEVTKKLNDYEDKYKTVTTLGNSASGATEISQMVKVIEERISPQKNPGKSQDEEDDEIVFNLKRNASGVNTPAKQTLSSPETRHADLANKLKDAELANIALRNKLKNEEDDYFKREQALIHGYSAEIDSLKHELAKFKTKTEGLACTKPQRGKKRAHLDISTCSSVSESYCESSEEKKPNLSRLDNVPEHMETDPGATILSNEVTTLQEQLASLTAAYKLLAQKQTSNENTSTTEEKEPVIKAAKQTENASAAPRYSLTNSVLLFEKEEYAIKFEEMSNRVVELETELKKLEKERDCNKADQDLVKSKVSETESKFELELSKTVEQKQVLSAELASTQADNAQIKQSLDAITLAKAKLESEFKEKEEMVFELKETIEKKNMLNNELENAMRLNEQKVLSLNADMEDLSRNLSEVTKERDIAGTDIQDLKSQLSSMTTQIKTMHEEKLAFEKEANEKVLQLQLRCDKTKQDLEERCKHLEENLLEKEKSFKRSEEDYCQRLSSLKEHLSSDCESKASALSSMQEQLGQVSSQLQEKSKALARMESLRQEEAAEVAQKLILLEKEKKTSERRALEASNREEEAQLKLQGYEAMKQEVEKLGAELQEASLREKEEKTLKSKLQEELALITQEVKQLHNNEIAMSLSNQDTETLKLQLSELEQALNTESQDKQQAINERKQLLEKVDELKEELLESEKTMDQQENVLSKQDEEIKDLKTELESSKLECTNLDKALTRKDLELANLNTQIRKCEEEVNTLRQSERRLWEAEQRVTHEKLLESSSNNGALQAKVELLEKEIRALEKSVKNKEQELEMEKEKSKELDGIKQELEKEKEKSKELDGIKQELKEEKESLKQLKTAEEELKEERLKLKQRLESTELELKNEREKLKQHLENTELQLQEEKEKLKQYLESTELQLKEQISKREDETKGLDELKSKNIQLQEEAEKAKLNLKDAKQALRDSEYRMQQMSETKKVIEKDLQKQESINKRNKEEMEHWKAERDSCVKKLEQCINKMTQEKELLTVEVEKLKKSNADLAQEATNITQRKDALISELKKSNNTMSIQLADAEGKTPPPKMATPELSFPCKFNFEEDIDTTGHLEIDATPVSLKRGKKRHTSLRHQASSSSVDPEATPEPKCLRTIKEERESPMSPGSKSPRIRVAELASEVIQTLSPLTRSSAKKQSVRNKKKKPVTQPPFETIAYGAPPSDEGQEDSSGLSTRRSSRLRCQTSKHSLV